MREAESYSCDVCSTRSGLDLGVDKIVEWSHRMGLGHKTGIDLPNEIPGLIGPGVETELMKQARVDQRWYPGDTVNLSIGQAASTTPCKTPS